LAFLGVIFGMTEDLKNKINELIVKASEIKEKVIDLIKAIYTLRQKINNEKRIQTNNRKF